MYSLLFFLLASVVFSFDQLLLFLSALTILHFLSIFSVSHRLHGPVHFIQYNNPVCKITFETFSESRKIEFLPFAVSVGSMCIGSVISMHTHFSKAKWKTNYILLLWMVFIPAVLKLVLEKIRKCIYAKIISFFPSFPPESMHSLLSYVKIYECTVRI